MASTVELALASAAALEALAIVATAGFGIRAYRQSQQTHRLQLLLGLSETFRQHWESGWDTVLEQVEAAQKQNSASVPIKHQRTVRFMLNWVDWLGTLVSHRALHDPGVIYSSIGLTIRRIIGAGRPIIEDDCREFGIESWQSLFVVVESLDDPKLSSWAESLPRRAQVSVQLSSSNE